MYSTDFWGRRGVVSSAGVGGGEEPRQRRDKAGRGWIRSRHCGCVGRLLAGARGRQTQDRRTQQQGGSRGVVEQELHANITNVRIHVRILYRPPAARRVQSRGSACACCDEACVRCMRTCGTGESTCESPCRGNLLDVCPHAHTTKRLQLTHAPDE